MRSKRVTDVVAVPDVRDPKSCECAEALAQGHRVGERLERMREVREPVDDRDGRVLGELLDLVLLERPDHERGQEAGEDERGVAVGLSAGELELGGGEEQRHAAELCDPDFERDARPRRRLVEDQPDRAARKDAQLGSTGALGLELVREIEERFELGARPGCDAREAPALQLRRDARHRPKVQRPTR